MDGKIVLHQKIIDKVKELSGKGPKGFTYSKLLDDLLEFTSEKKELIGKILYDEFSTSGLADEKKLRLALAREGTDAGAMPGLRDLLCFYGFKKNYEYTIEKKCKSTLQKEFTISEQLRKRPKVANRLTNEVRFLFENNFNSIESKVNRLLKIDDDLQTIQEWDNAIHEKDRSKVESLTEEVKERLKGIISDATDLIILSEIPLMQIYDQQENYSECLSSAQYILRLLPDFFPAHYYAALSYFHLGLLNEGRNSLQKIFSTEFFYTDALILECAYLMRLGLIERARITIEKTLSAYNDQYLFIIDWKRLITPLKINDVKITATEAQLVNLLWLKANICNTQEDYGTALEAANSGLKIEENIKLIISKIVALVNMKLSDEAIPYIDTAIKEHPNNPILWYYHAIVLAYKRVDKEMVLEQLKKTIKLNPEFAQEIKRNSFLREYCGDLLIDDICM